MLSRYKEILYGFAIGISTWLLDVMMHSSMHGHLSLHSFLEDLTTKNITQQFFRLLFIVIAIAFGVALWRSNQRKHQVQSLQISIDSFHQQVINPLTLMVGYLELLSLKEGWPTSKENIELVENIKLNANKINDLMKLLPPPGIPSSEMYLKAFSNAHTEDSIVGRKVI